MQSGIVTKVDVKFKVGHVISGQVIDEWKTLHDVKVLDDVTVGDYVVYNDWIGQVSADKVRPRFLGLTLNHV